MAVKDDLLLKEQEIKELESKINAQHQSIKEYQNAIFLAGERIDRLNYELYILKISRNDLQTQKVTYW